MDVRALFEAPIRVDDRMPDLSGASGCAAQHSAVHHEASANAGPERHHSDVRCAARGAAPALGEQRAFRIVLEHGAHATRLCDERREPNLVPLRECGGTLDGPVFRICSQEEEEEDGQSRLSPSTSLSTARGATLFTDDPRRTDADGGQVGHRVRRFAHHLR